jgi:hypothetical protein
MHHWTPIYRRSSQGTHAMLAWLLFTKYRPIKYHTDIPSRYRQTERQLGRIVDSEGHKLQFMYCSASYTSNMGRYESALTAGNSFSFYHGSPYSEPLESISDLWWRKWQALGLLTRYVASVASTVTCAIHPASSRVIGQTLCQLYTQMVLRTIWPHGN